MKRTPVIVLIVLLFIQAGGLLMFYQFKQAFVRFQMHEMLKQDDGNTEQMILTLAEYKRYRRGEGEISIGGTMYDIKSLRHIHQKVELMVIADHRESDIIEKIKLLLPHSSENDSGLPIPILNLLKLVYIHSPAGFKLGILSDTHIIYFSQVDKSTAGFISTFSPPPDFA